MGKKKKQVQEAEVPISSMIDIVFLLIIFFVVTASIDKEIEDERVILADAPHGRPVKKKDPRSVTINVLESGEINIAKIPMSLDMVSNQLKSAASKFGNDMPIIIRGDGKAQHFYIKKVMEAVTRTRLYRVKFSAEIKDK